MHPELGVWDRSDHSPRGWSHGHVEGAVRFTLLGQLEVLKDGIDCAPRAPKILQLLAMLLLRAGSVVQTDSIIHELWSDYPPRSFRTTMHTYVYQLRRCIERNGLAVDGDEVLVTKPPGYALRINPAQVDVFVFRRLCQYGKQSLANNCYKDAAHSFRSALSLWSGPPMANVNCGSVLSAYAVELQEQRRNAHHLRIQAEIDGGMSRELIGELRSLVTTNPHDEGLHGQLMHVLSRSGRRVDALAAYRKLREKLNEELGVEPCGELQKLHCELLADEPPQ